MAVEYYVKDKETGEVVATCQTSEQAQKVAGFPSDKYAVVYSEDALKKWKARQAEARG